MLNSNVTTYPLKAKARSANITLKKMWSMIFDSYQGWQYNDTNNLGVPIVYTTLITGQDQYSLPTEASTIRGVEILAQNGNTYATLVPITEELLTQYGIAEASVFTSFGTPIYYRPIGNIIKIYPKPNYTQALGLRLTFDSEVSLFLPTDTTKKPGLDSQFHEMVGVGMALEYARANATANFNTINEQWNDWSMKLKAFYSRKYQELFPARMTVRDSTRDYM
jgi:hypothetical protein